MATVSLKQAIRNNLSNTIQNTKVLFHCLKERRDSSIWLFGAWMGNRFADNSRFLFQYLNEHREEYGITELVWATRSETVCKELQELGYKSIIIGTEESNYYHLKAGVHVICNSSYTDIDSRLSAGAKKVQLWHGVGGCKAVGRLNRNKVTLRQKLADIFIWPFFEPGHWYRAFFLASSPENARIVQAEHGCRKKQIFEAITPRLCKCEKYKPSEEKTIEEILRYSKADYRIVLYLPTFRSSSYHMLSPTDISGFEDVLTKEKILWVQKYHSVANEKNDTGNISKNIIKLDPDFDINVLYDYIDLLVTDYSSASSDAYYKHVRTLEYCPDMKEYMSQERQFIAEFSLYHAEDPITNPDEFLEALCTRVKSMTRDIEKRYERVRNLLFSDNSESLSAFMQALLTKLR